MKYLVSFWIIALVALASYAGPAIAQPYAFPTDILCGRTVDFGWNANKVIVGTAYGVVDTTNLAGVTNLYNTTCDYHATDIYGFDTGETIYFTLDGVRAIDNTGYKAGCVKVSLNVKRYGPSNCGYPSAPALEDKTDTVYYVTDDISSVYQTTAYCDSGLDSVGVPSHDCNSTWHLPWVDFDYPGSPVTRTWYKTNVKAWVCDTNCTSNCTQASQTYATGCVQVLWN